MEVPANAVAAALAVGAATGIVWLMLQRSFAAFGSASSTGMEQVGSHTTTDARSRNSRNPKDVWSTKVAKRPETFPLSARWLAAAWTKPGDTRRGQVSVPYNLRPTAHASGL